KQLLLLTLGEYTAAIVKRPVEAVISNTVAASSLQQYPDARLVLDPASAAELSRITMPRTLTPIVELGMSWDVRTRSGAAIWVAKTLQKPILKLTDDDYNEHGLQDLVAARGDAYDINIEVFRALSKTITGWPGGKPEQAGEAFP